MGILKKMKLYYEEKLPGIIDALKKGYKPEKIILFGSMLDSDRDSNDIDLFLIKNTGLKRLGDRAQEAEKFIPYDDIPVDLIVYSSDEVERYKDNSVLLHEVFKGKVLYG